MAAGREDVPPALDRLVLRCLSKRPAERPACDALREALRSMARGPGPRRQPSVDSVDGADDSSLLVTRPFAPAADGSPGIPSAPLPFDPGPRLGGARPGRRVLLFLPLAATLALGAVGLSRWSSGVVDRPQRQIAPAAKDAVGPAVGAVALVPLDAGVFDTSGPDVRPGPPATTPSAVGRGSRRARTRRRLTRRRRPPSALRIATVHDGHSTPADVHLDGAAVGQTPLVLNRLPPGRHRVQISKKGFVTARRRVVLAPGTVTKLVVYLER